MILISNMGNLEGRDPIKENSTESILNAINKGFKVRVHVFDVCEEENVLYIGDPIECPYYNGKEKVKYKLDNGNIMLLFNDTILNHCGSIIWTLQRSSINFFVKTKEAWFLDRLNENSAFYKFITISNFYTQGPFGLTSVYWTDMESKCSGDFISTIYYNRGMKSYDPRMKSIGICSDYISYIKKDIINIHGHIGLNK